MLRKAFMSGCVALACAATSFGGCVGDGPEVTGSPGVKPDPNVPVGQHRGACTPDRLCIEGLECIQGVCLYADGGDAPPPPPPSNDGGQLDALAPGRAGCEGALSCMRVMFATKATYPGDFGASGDPLGTADGYCAAAAAASRQARVKGRAFRAWLSTSEVSAESRHPRGTEAYVNSTGAPLAPSFQMLLTSGVTEPILDENGDQPSANVWTGTQAGGTAAPGQTCDDWSGGSDGLTGDPGGIGSEWTANMLHGCEGSYPLYCIEY